MPVDHSGPVPLTARSAVSLRAAMLAFLYFAKIFDFVYHNIFIYI